MSCAIKPVVQIELGRYTMATGRTALEGFHLVPGPRLGAGWLVWAWAITVTLTLLQVGAMYGGAAQILHLVVPAMSVNIWVGVCVVVTLALLLGGGYARVERLAIVKVSLFTLLTVCAAGVLLLRPDAVTVADLSRGLSFELPAAGLATAMAVFGITGVGATELVQYPYWCIEKGYARFVGPRDGSAAWLARARGWMRVMRLDILCSLVIYTMATVAFYLLGAGVLNRLGLVPADRDTVVGALADLHGDARRLGALGLLRRRDRDALRDDLRLDRGALAHVRRLRAGGRRLRPRGWRAPPVLAQRVRRVPVGGARVSSTGGCARRCRWSWPAASRR